MQPKAPPMFHPKSITLGHCLLLICSLLITGTSKAEKLNGFDLRYSLIPSNKILQGGPPRDGIPAINNPKFVSASKARHVAEKDRVLALELNGVSKAYPISILNWHEIVNDKLGPQQVSITYCPLCGTGVAFDAKVNGRAHTFGVSGLLYNSDALLYDKETHSLWSQVMGQAVTGPLKGSHLSSIPLEHTSWADWRQRHPDTLVLSTDTGYRRDYDRDPYQGYEQSRALYFEVSHQAPPNYHPKERVLGLEVEGMFKAYPYVELNKTKEVPFYDEFNGKKYKISWNKEHQSGRIYAPEGNQLPTISAFWFAWFTFHPDTLLFRTNQPQE